MLNVFLLALCSSCVVGNFEAELDSEPHESLLEAVSRTKNWIQSLPSYEVEVQRKRYTEFEVASTSTTRIELIHEAKVAKKTAIIRTAGVWQVDVGQGGSVDSLKSSFYLAEDGNARIWTKGYATARVPCDGLNCLNASNFHIEHAVPLLTAMPLERQFEINHLEEVIRYVREKPKQVTSSTKNVNHFEQKKKSVRAFIIQMNLTSPDSERVEAFGAEFLVSNEGADTGYIIAVNWLILADPKKGAVDSNIRFRERETRTRWKVINEADNQFVVPEVSESKCFQLVDGKRVTVVSQTENWKFNKTGSEVVTKDLDGLLELSAELENRVNRMLNR